MRTETECLEPFVDPRCIQLEFSDPELSNRVTESAIPTGVSVSRPVSMIQASDPAQILSQVVLITLIGIPVGVLGDWLYDRLKTPGKKTTRIQNKQTPVTRREVVRLLNQVIASDDPRRIQLQGERKQTKRRNKGSSHNP